MIAHEHTTWPEANQHYLMARVGVVRAALLRHAGDAVVEEEGEQDRVEAAAAAMPAPAALDELVTRFGLSDFERDVLLLCAGVELDASFAALCARAQGDAARVSPSFSLALAALPEAHWSALTPAGPLRQWRMIEVGHGSLLTLSTLRIDERILHYLAGVDYLDERLAGLVDWTDGEARLVPSHQRLAERIAAAWKKAVEVGEPLPVVQLAGSVAAERRGIALGACTSLGVRLAEMTATALPLSAAEIDSVLRLWRRESILSDAVLLFECHDPDAGDAARAAAVERVMETLGSPLIVSGNDRGRNRQGGVLQVDVSRLTADEQCLAWREALGADVSASLDGQLDMLSAQFDLTLPKLQAACDEAGLRDDDELGHALWEACRRQARPALDDLAQRIEPAAVWDDLVLPPAQLRVLRDIVLHVRQRTKVYGTWGFRTKGSRGLGISALFSGASGTGKTMAAEVMAGVLQLDLYRIDLSSVVSKYIGETEKNLRRVFDAAEEGGAILLFDEADALFGKRSEVKDSHDRYANIEVSYLLQRMESYRGLAILTTNLKNALDPAFLRRLRFAVQFPFPDAASRARIWARIFPAQTPLDQVDPAKLAALNVAGGNIRNIALGAAFLAADADEPVRMSHLLRSAEAEYAKLEKPLSEAEVRGWV